MLITPNVNPVAKIKVIGVGGAGGNSVDTMISDFNIPGVEFMAFNTDSQALKKSLAPVTLQLGSELTRGLGVGGDHMLGAQSAEESLDEIHEHLAGADMVFITAGMGGGTGTGAAPVVAGVAKNLGALTVAVVTKPFNFEGRHRQQVAEEGLAELRDKVDTLIIVPNQRLLEIVDEQISFMEAMKKVDNVLAEGVKSISSLVTQTGFINVDFADVKTIMTNAGSSLMGIGRAKGENRAEEAARMATSSPLLDMSIEGATGVLFNVIGGLDMTMREVDLAAQMIYEAVDPNANIIFGATVDETMKDELAITIIATGFDSAKQVYTPKIRATVTNASDPVNSVAPTSSTTNTPSLVSSKNDFNMDFDADELETDFTAQAKPANPTPTPTLRQDKSADDYSNENKDLEVPAFLRRKTR